MLSGDRPLQLVIAGKAHPRDEEGKRLVQHLFTFKWAPEVGGRVVYLDDYDLSSAARMVRGCDVWVNLPRPPLEASGTSGMKSAVNGGLQLSVLDGWWAEGYDGTNGWALSGEEDADHGAQDHRDGAELHRLLEEEVAREFYERDADGLPARVARSASRASLATNGPEFSATRMVQDYVKPVLQRRRARLSRHGRPAGRRRRPRRRPTLAGPHAQRRPDVLGHPVADLRGHRREDRLRLAGVAGALVEADADEPGVLAVDERHRPAVAGQAGERVLLLARHEGLDRGGERRGRRPRMW